MQNAFKIILSKKAQFFATFLAHTLFFKNPAKNFHKSIDIHFHLWYIERGFRSGVKKGIS